MPRLNLKQTPEERAERKRRKARKAERRSRRRDAHTRAHDDDTRKRDSSGKDRGWDDDEGWIPPDASQKIDEDEIRAEVEDRIFREKLFDAMHDDGDHRLDGLETRFNDYYIPRRWKSGPNGDHDGFDNLAGSVNEMGDEEYAEWMREGMWRRTHKAEMEERESRKAEREARKEQERKAREETARLERRREAERKLRHEIKEKHRQRAAWGYYETRWKSQTGNLKFEDIPWPVFSVPHSPQDLTSERISKFLLYDIDEQDPTSKRRRERVREALLRWHPDKFEGKMGSRLDVGEREKIMEGVGTVARCLNEMNVN